MIANRSPRHTLRALLVLTALVLMPRVSSAAATIVIQNGNAAGVGFNESTPAAPVGGNGGTTLGQQRLIAFQAAADTWGATLTSTQTIVVLATMEPLTCTATSAVLGSAGALQIWRDFPGAPIPGHWYPQALANKITATNLDPSTADIRARFNSNLGQPGCLTGSPFYLGLDNNHGAKIDLVTVLLHELGHGLGFQTFTNGSSGAYQSGFPSAWDAFIRDNTQNKFWDQMTNAERVTSALNPRNVVWGGTNVTNAVPAVLSPGTPLLTATAPAAVAGSYQVGTAAFGPVLSSPGTIGELMPVIPQVGGTGPGCEPFNAVNAAAVNGKVALIDRGVCGFVVKVKNAQNAGAIGVLIGDNVAGGPPSGMAGVDPTITIPSVRITLADANKLRTALATRSRTRSGLNVTLGVDVTRYAGADTLGRVFLYTPNPFESGSSVSHWDTLAFRNLLMEPAINGDLLHSVQPPEDLTFRLFQDIGW
jgi:hypothetical protein